MRLLLAFKLQDPSCIHILRGNHESKKMNERNIRFGGGFTQECMNAFKQDGAKVHALFEQLFIRLPLFGVIGEKVFVVHGGLPRFDDVKIEQLRRMQYKMDWSSNQLTPSVFMGEMTDDIVSKIMLFDAVWADPHAGIGIVPCPQRGAMSIAFGSDITDKFCKNNGLDFVIRSHQLPSSDGYLWAHNNRLLTVFSASNYGRMSVNDAAVAILRKNGGEDLITDVFKHMNVDQDEIREASELHSAAVEKISQQLTNKFGEQVFK